MRARYAGIDWLTMTTNKDAVGHFWYEIYRRYRAENISEELAEVPFHNGFYGGVRCGSMRWGYSETLGYIIIASGQDANHLFDSVQPSPGRVTRIDLCLDCMLVSPKNLARDAYRMVQAKRVKRPKFALYTGTDGGNTLYVGSRHSQQFGRLYDKGVESGIAAAGILWRWEVEYKKPGAAQVFDVLAHAPPTERVSKIRDTVASWYGNRHIEHFAAGTLDDAIEVTTEKRVTTKDRKLAWLRSQVAPSVSQLIAAGHGKDVLRSLLLDKRQIEKIFYGNGND